MELAELNKKITVIQNSISSKNTSDAQKKALGDTLVKLEKLRSDIEANTKKVSKAEEIIAKANVKIKRTSKKTVASKPKNAAKTKAVKEKVVAQKTKAKATVEKNKVVKEITAAKKTAAEILAKYKNLSVRDFNKGRSSNEIIDDLNYQAKAPGKRVSANGNTYYEGRPNRSDISSTKKLGKGGSIENQYAGKSASEVWDMWTVEQRTHFLRDHESVLGFKDSTYYNLVNLPFSKLHKNMQVVIEYHVGTGEYAKGGKMSTYHNGGGIERKYMIRDHNDYPVEKDLSEDELIRWAKQHAFDNDCYKTIEYLEDAKDYIENKGKFKDDDRESYFEVYTEYAHGGKLHNEDGDSFHKGDKVKKRSTGEKAEVIRRNHNGNSHNESYVVKCDSGKEAYWWASDMEICYECGGMAYGGGGEVKEDENLKEGTIKQAVEIALEAYKNGIFAKDNTFESYSDKVFESTMISYPIVSLRIAYQSMLNKGD
jgi:hypothetical protein